MKNAYVQGFDAGKNSGFKLNAKELLLIKTCFKGSNVSQEYTFLN